MSFDLARTPTLEAVATEDEHRLAQDLQKRVEESIATAEQQAEVVAAVAAHQDAEEHLSKLKKAERVLSGLARELREQAAAAARTAIETLVASACAGEKPDFKKLLAQIAIESENGLVTRAIEQIIEHLLPLAQIAALRGESHAAMSRARALESIARERAERVLGQMREAITEEMVLPVDLSKGVSGALLARAAALKKMAIQISANADEIERAYNERNRR
jgi:hypothetical protein